MPQVQQQVVLGRLQVQQLHISQGDLVGSNEVLYHQQQLSGLNRRDVLEVFDQVQPADLEDLFDRGLFFPSHLFDDVGTIPVGKFQLNEFFLELYNWK